MSAASGRCRHCGVFVLGDWADRLAPGCALGRHPVDGACCYPIAVNLYSMALRRALCPGAFDAAGRPREGRVAEAVAAEREALRAAAASRGPVPAEARFMAREAE